MGFLALSLVVWDKMGLPGLVNEERIGVTADKGRCMLTANRTDFGDSRVVGYRVVFAEKGRFLTI